MPKLACWSCGRQIYAVAPIDSLFAEERRCPRCGAFMDRERREGSRDEHRAAGGAAEDPLAKDEITERRDGVAVRDEILRVKERRVEDRRKTRRRGSQTQLDDDSWME